MEKTGVADPGLTLLQKRPKSKKSMYFTAFLLLLLTFFAYHWQSASTSSQLEFRLYTNNIRYDNKKLTVGEKPWVSRGPLVAQSIETNVAYWPSVVCLQEVLHNQLQDILQFLNKGGTEWGYYGVGRTDGKEKGEFAPILFKRADWELESSKTYWLSETPDVPSVGWDADLERIVTEVRLKSRINGQLIKVLNTHFDHKGVKARRESVKLILSKLETGDEPSFLCGDLNTQSSDEPYKMLKRTNFIDSRTFKSNPDEFEPTFTGFSDAEKSTIIDYIWADPKSEWRGYHVLPNYFGFYMSDHRPVAAEYLV